MFASLLLASGIYILILDVHLLFYSCRFKNIFYCHYWHLHACMYVCKIYEILSIPFTIIVCALLQLSNIQVKFMIIPFVLLLDPGFVSEVKHSKLPSQKRKLDYGNSK